MLCEAFKYNADNVNSKFLTASLFLIQIILVTWFTAWPDQQLYDTTHGSQEAWKAEEGMRVS